MLALLIAALAAQSPQLPLFAPAGLDPARVVPGGTSILPNGRLLTPGGERLYTGEDLWHITVNPSGDSVIGFNDGGLTSHSGFRSGVRVRKAVAVKGLAPAGRFTPDGQKLVVSLGDDGAIGILDPFSFERAKTIDLNVGGVKDTYIVDLLLTKDGETAYALDVANQQLVTVDLKAGVVRDRKKAGRQPYALAMNEDGTRIYVANIGLFDYSVVGSVVGGKPKGISRPPYEFPGKESEDGVEFEGKKIPGLGSPLVPDAQSISMYSVSGGIPSFVKSAKSGLLIHAPADSGKAVGGSAPNALLVRGGRLYVSNANSDTVQVFDGSDLKTLSTFRLTPTPLVSRLRGVIPSGMAMDKAGKRLYVCESGLNAVAVLDPRSGKVLGQIPTGWFPMEVTLWEDQFLLIADQKGIGRGPRGPLSGRPANDDRTGLPDMPGMIHRVPVPTDAELPELTQKVLANNGLVPSHRPLPNFPKEIEYVVFITKENHTFDGIFGGMKGVEGQPEYAQFGMNGWIAEKGRSERLPIMPNHIRLAEQFGISDNFYMEPQASGDGHRWLVGVYPSLWSTRLFYAGWDFRLNNDAKGRLVPYGSNGSQIPEDYLENGSLWEHLDRNKISFRNYGEGFEFPGVGEDEPESRTGAVEVVNYPMPKALMSNTCFDFPIFNTNIPDIARVDWFKEDIEKNYRSKGKPLPKFINIALCNDHGDRARLAAGYPYVCSYMADNDLALGRTVEYLSHTPEWKKMAIFVTQDDSGGDNDHIDRHRSFVLAISPYAKRGYVAHEHTSIMSIIRSIYSIFGLGPNNLFDAMATPLDEMFTTTPDFTPYTHVPVDPRVFKPEATMDPSDPTFKKRRGLKSVRMDDPKFLDWMNNRGK
ncbi:alkaline phosphatase family protein [Fimbriimonas ginsengisoli]|uniref:40-residue YVTN family beta-propeller repeat protein n=1 Tax=Fimbriimonas ginsengisoli Gsoil 348 TaxID=661478 RepID=A0A068NKA8_FIMGI|nr:alkaline phosphatase family protein [Fimbriimonas ginsengisoli]AIE83882.1 40-residue YVTN family beta-propeller repeat protein [Fimbriimonas ginsengisoli Gsoil 348]